MAINWTEAQIEEVIAKVIKNLGGGASTIRNDWDSKQYNGRKLIGIYADMNDAIDAATAGYKAIRAMSLEEREKVIAVSELRQEYKLTALLKLAGIARSTYYYHLKVLNKSDGENYLKRQIG